MKPNRLLAAAATAAVCATTAASAAASGGPSVGIRDLCDPVSFNKAIAADACVRPAGDRGGDGVVFGDFIAELASQHSVDGWSFDRERVALHRGQVLSVVRDRGGEFHTFTEVAAFGPGCIRPVNALTFGDPTPSPLCADPTLLGRTGVPVGSSLSVTGLSAGVHRFQCMIHPWMKTTVTVR